MTDGKRDSRTCAFCGKNNLSREHIFAKWIRDAFSDDPSVAVMELQKDDSLVWSYNRGALEQRVKAVCTPCNNVWMSRLEERAAAIMRPMLKAEHVGVKMGYQAQTTVASWAMKTAMVLQQLHPSDSRIPIADYRAFHRRQEPSSNVFVLMGARHIAGNGKGANMFQYKDRFLGNDVAGIQHVHFAIGALYFGIAMFVGRRRAYPRRMNDEAALRALQIWPTSQPEVVWPSLSISEIGGVDGMFDAFVGAIWK